MFEPHHPDADPLAGLDWTPDQSRGDLQSLFLDRVYDTLGISVTEGNAAAVSFDRGQETGIRAMNKFTAFHRPLARTREAIILRVTDPEHEMYSAAPELITGINTFFLTIGGEVSEELDHALVDMNGDISESVLKKALNDARDPAKLEQARRSLCIRYGNTMSMLCEAIDISAYKSFNHSIHGDKLAAYRRGCYTALFAFAGQMEMGSKPS